MHELHSVVSIFCAPIRIKIDTIFKCDQLHSLQQTTIIVTRSLITQLHSLQQTTSGTSNNNPSHSNTCDHAQIGREI